MELSLPSLSDAVKAVLNGRSWRHAFEHLGLTGLQTLVTGGLLKQLQLSGVPTVEPLFPTFEELVACFPKRLEIPIDDVFGCVAKLSCPPSGEPLGPDGSNTAPGPAVPVWYGRTRSTSSSAVVCIATPPLPPPAESIEPAVPCPPTTSLVRLRRLGSLRASPQSTPSKTC